MTEEAAPEPSAEVKALQRVGVASPKPITAGDVLALYNWKRQDPEEVGLRRWITEIREAVDMRDPISIPKEYKAITQVVRTPFLRDVKERVAASLVNEDPVYAVEPRDDTIEARKSAAIAGQWTGAMMAAMRKSHPAQDLIHQSALNLVADSESVIKVVHRPEAWANFPVRGELRENESARAFNDRAERHRKGGVRDPFAGRVVDRLQMVFGDGEYGDEWAIEYGQYPTPYLAAKYGALSTEIAPVTQIGGEPVPEGGISNAVFSGGRGGGGQMLKLEYVDAQQWAVVVNGRMAPGFPTVNPYAPFLPWFRAVSLPTLYALKSLVPALNALLTMKMNWAYLTAYPIPVIEALATANAMLESLPVGDGQAPVPEEVWKWKPGKEHFLPPGYTMRFLEPPGTGRDLDQMIADLREMIDIAGVPSVLRGIGGARQPGYAINQLMAAAQLTYRSLGRALGYQQEAIQEFQYHCVRHTINDAVYVLGEAGDTRRWVGLRPTGRLTEELAAVDALGPAKVTFRPILPTDEQSEAMIGIQVTNPAHPLLSDYTAVKHYFSWVDDADAEADRLSVQKMLAAPTIEEQIQSAALRKAGMPLAQGGGVPQPTETAQSGPLPNDQTNAGEPQIPGLTMPTVPNAPLPGGRPAGANPGEPGGPNLP